MKMALAVLVIFASCNAGLAGDCQKLLRHHAILSRAQFQCHFSRYSEAMIQSARSCAKGMSEAAIKHLAVAPSDDLQSTVGERALLR